MTGEEMEQIAQAIRKLAKWLSDAYASFLEICRNELDIILNRTSSEKPLPAPLYYKLDLTRPLITHQVTDRKPRLVKKIIH